MRSIDSLSCTALGAALLGLSGCSLLTVEFPETPLSDREMNARLATHRFVERFIGEVRDAADRIAEDAEEESVLLDSIRWKIGSTVAVSVTAFQTSPRDALVDTWAYCAQMSAFFRDGAGSGMFGSRHELALATSVGLEQEIARLALKFAPVLDAERHEQFVTTYAAENPLPDLMTPRESSVPAFYAFMQIDDTDAIETVGTLGQVLNDFGSRVTILGDQLPQETAWRTELFLREQGVDRRSLQEELERFGARMERVAVVAEGAPVLVDDSLVRLRQELATLIEAIGIERAAAMDALGRERAIVVEALSRERVATLEELQTYGDKLLADTFAQAKGLAGIVLFGLIALVLVLFGVPFGVGVLVGRLSKRRA